MRPVVLALAILTVGPHGTASDFDFRIRYGSCVFDSLDSKQGTFVREVEPDYPITLRLTLPTTTKQAIFEAIRDARFFEYPTTFRDQISDGVVRTMPFVSYQLEVRTSEGTHAVSWDDNITPTSAEAIRLRTMFNKIIVRINALPEVMALPRPNVGCR